MSEPGNGRGVAAGAARAAGAAADRAPAVLHALERLGAPVVHAHSLHVLPGAARTIARQPSAAVRSAERALVLAGPDDVVCLAAPPDAAFIDCLARLGLAPADPARIVVPGGSPGDPLGERLAADPAAIRRIAALLPPDGTVWFGPTMAAPADAPFAAALGALRRGVVRKLGGDPALVARANRKDVVRAAALAIGVPVAGGTVVELAPDDAGRPRDLAPLHAAIRRHAARTGRTIVRGAIGSGGSSVLVASGDGVPAGPIEALVAGAMQSIYLVEECLDVLASPNVQTCVDPADGRAFCVGVTDQLLGADLVYRGNVYPSRAATIAAMVEAALALSEWLAGDGFRGFLGFDFVEYPAGDGRPDWLLAELNPRLNGATQPVAMLERLNRERLAAGRPPIAAFAAGVVPIRAGSWAELERRLGARRYDPVAGHGVLPFHTAGLPDGRCGLAVFGASRDEVEREFVALAGSP